MDPKTGKDDTAGRVRAVHHELAKVILAQHGTDPAVILTAVQLLLVEVIVSATPKRETRKRMVAQSETTVRDMIRHVSAAVAAREAPQFKRPVQ